MTGPTPPQPPPPASPFPALPQVPARAGGNGGGNPCRDHGCSACCHDVEMLLTDADVARIRAARPGLDFFFVADDGYLQLRTRDGPPAAGAWGGDGAGPPSSSPPAPVSGESVARPCIFLDPSGACAIHPVRPEGCRLYPAVWDDGVRDAELDADYCPHTDGFALPRATRDAVARLARRLEAERRARAP